MNLAYKGFFRAAMKEEMRYFFSDAFMQSLSTLLYIGLAMMLYRATGATLFFGVFTWSMLAWYLIATQFIMRTHGHLVSNISKEVNTGEIVTLLMKPVHYPLTVMSVHLGESAVTVVALITVLLPFGLIVAGPVLSIQGILAFAILLVGSMVLNCCIAICLGLIAFWTEDAKPYDWIYSKMLLVLGGTVVPLDLLPPWLNGIAKQLPTAFIIYYPARLFVDFSWPMLLQALLGQLVYIIIIGTIAFSVYRAAVRQVNINGG
jgi:ABC-2 type transport system permease protein